MSYIRILEAPMRFSPVPPAFELSSMTKSAPVGELKFDTMLWRWEAGVAPSRRQNG